MSLSFQLDQVCRWCFGVEFLQFPIGNEGLKTFQNLGRNANNSPHPHRSSEDFLYAFLKQIKAV